MWSYEGLIKVLKMTTLQYNKWCFTFPWRLPFQSFQINIESIVALAFHLGKFSSIIIDHGRPDGANGCLEWLKQLVKVLKIENNSGVFNISTMKLKLVEEKDMKYHNGSSNTMCCAKHIICNPILLLNRIISYYYEK